MVANINVEQLILGHFSLRYSHALIDHEIQRLAQHYGVKIPIFRVLPGEFKGDILGEKPIFNG